MAEHLENNNTEAPAATHTENNAPAAHGAEGEHGGGHGGGSPELENFWNIMAVSPLNKEGTFTHKIIQPFDPYVKDPKQASMHKVNQNIFFGILTIIAVIWLFRAGIRKRALIPGRFQSVVEILIEGMAGFFTGILGEKHARKYLPFLMALFFFILFSNLMGLLPLMKASTSTFQTNIVLGLCVFFYVQSIGLRQLGIKKYLMHLMGNPKDAVSWAISPMLFVIEILGELIKPLSLSLRLFGNIMGEDILLGVFAMLGIMIAGPIFNLIGSEHTWVGIPLHTPFMFLATLTSVIQALVFSVLSCIYILLMLPHDEHGESAEKH